MSAEHLPFYSDDLSRDNAAHVPESLAAAGDVLADPRLDEYAQQGLLTVALIRPNVHQSIATPVDTDVQAADEIESRIENLGVMAKFSMTLDEQAVDEFYGGGHASPMHQYPAARYPERFANRQQEFAALMTDGPVTIYLLYGPDAVTAWRDQLGHWDIEKVRDPSTIRGQLGKDNYNNLLHGSDSKESVAREMNVIRRAIARKLEQSES